MTTHSNTPHASPPLNTHRCDSERLRAESAVATMLLADLGPALGHDEHARSARCRALSRRITATLIGMLYPERQSPPPQPCPVLRYDERKLPDEQRRVTAEQIHSLLGSAFAELVSEKNAGRETVWAVMLTDMVLNEIGQDLLDSPIVYAADIARTVERVSTYLRGTTAAQRAPGEEDLQRATSDIFYLIIQEACPSYLVEGIPDQPAQRWCSEVFEVTEARLTTFPRAVAAFVRGKSRHNGPKQYTHIICSCQQVDGVFVLHGAYDDVRIFWSGPFITRARDNYVFFHPQDENAKTGAGTIWVLCDWLDETVSLGFGQDEEEERICLGDLGEEGQAMVYICQIQIAGSVSG